MKINKYVSVTQIIIVIIIIITKIYVRNFCKEKICTLISDL